MGLLEALKQFAGDAAGGSLNPEVGNTLSGLLNYGKDRAKYIGGLLDDSSPISKDFKNWHDRTQLGLADLIAGKEGPQADYGYSQIMNMAGNAPMGITKVVGPRHQAMETARKNAVKMLGLPENNTAMDRAKAMAVDYPTAHGTRDDVLQIATEKTGTRIGANPSSHLGFFSTPNLPEASRYATDFGKSGGNVMPLLVHKGKTYEMPNKQFEELSMGEFTAQGATPKERWLNASEEVKALRQQLLDDGYDSVVRFAGRPMEEVISLKPENVRSRFAAFDPARRHEVDLLGRATPEMLGLTTLGSLLGLEAMRRNQE